MLLNCLSFLVVHVHEGWVVRGGPAELGPYYDYNVALKTAFVAAMSAKRNGRASKIEVHGSDSNRIAEYCLCKQAKFAA